MAPANTDNNEDNLMKRWDLLGFFLDKVLLEFQVTDFPLKLGDVPKKFAKVLFFLLKKE